MMTVKNSIPEIEQVNESVLAFLVEQYGEKVKELVDQTESSFVKLKYEGKKDDIAEMVEGLHYHPLDTHTSFLDSGLMMLGALIHKRMVVDVFLKRINEINFVCADAATSIGDLRYIVSLSENTFKNRESFRADVDEYHDTKDYARYVSVDIEFLPSDINFNDLIDDKLMRLNLEEYQKSHGGK